MNKLFVFISLSLLLLIATNGVAQSSNTNELPKKVKKELNKLKDRFSKKKFIKDIEAQRAEHQEMVIRVKRFKDNNGHYALKNDQEIINAYDQVMNAYNEVLDSMASQINGITDVRDFVFFDANKRYKEQLTKANQLGNEFMGIAEMKLSGETKFLGGLLRWFIKIGPMVKKVIKKVGEIYLAYAKPIMIKKIEATKYLSWDDILIFS